MEDEKPRKKVSTLAATTTVAPLGIESDFQVIQV